MELTEREERIRQLLVGALGCWWADTKRARARIEEALLVLRYETPPNEQAPAGSDAPRPGRCPCGHGSPAHPSGGLCAYKGYTCACTGWGRPVDEQRARAMRRR